VYATGTFNAPLVEGDYILESPSVSIFANVIRAGETGEIFYATDPAGVAGGTAGVTGLLVHVIPPPGDPPAILSWRSCGTHLRNVGEVCLDIGASDTSTEPRISGITRVVVTFDGEVNPATATPGQIEVSGCTLNNVPVDLSGIAVGAATAAANTQLVITFTPKLPDFARYRIAFSGVQAVAGGVPGQDTDRFLFVVLGDANGDRRVTALDVGGVRSLVGIDPIDANNTTQVRSDANNDGRITALDVGGVRSKVGNDARAITCP
jgi:hypothetical protein